MIAGEALVGLVFAAMYFYEIPVHSFFEHPSFIGSLFVFAIVAFVLIATPLRNAGSPDEAAPPSAMA